MARSGRSGNVATRVLGWLRAGYPDGVPQQDYVALLGILRRHLTDEEIVEIARSFLGTDEAGLEPRIRAAIQSRTLQPATDDEVARVAARLHDVGWSLDELIGDGEATRDTEARITIVTRLIAWVRQGYPSGVPAADYVPLIALLSRRLTKDEVIDIVIELRGAGVVPSETGRIGAAIMGTTNEVPSLEEIERVREHLAEMTGTDFGGVSRPA